MKKKIFALLLACLLIFSLAACAGTETPPTDSATVGSGQTPNASVGGSASSNQGTGTTKDAVDLALRYDDRYQFPDDIAEITTVEVTSKKAGTDKADDKVLKKKSALDRDTAVAVGVGKATVTLKNGDVYNVTVTAAPISVFLIIGQSNGEGSTDSTHCVESRNQSIVCEEGQIYSTYAWSTTGHASSVAGITSSNYLTVSNAKNFVATSLTSNKSWGGTTLEYPLDSLAAGGKGKTGFDSGLAWKWHKLTGEKVWVVNCAAGSTAIEVWQPEFTAAAGEKTPSKMNRYNMCVALMENVKKTMDAEVAAGHYTLETFAYFWLQGESNRNNTKDDYRAKLDHLHESLKEDLILTGNKTLDGMGNILVRAFTTSNPATDTIDNGPRSAQKEFVAANADAFMACDVNDQWITAQGVTEYWETVYPNSEYPFESRSMEYVNPTEIATVHGGVHYYQPGYNEIGIVSATSAFEFFD